MISILSWAQHLTTFFSLSYSRMSLKWDLSTGIWSEVMSTISHRPIQAPTCSSIFSLFHTYWWMLMTTVTSKGKCERCQGLWISLWTMVWIRASLIPSPPLIGHFVNGKIYCVIPLRCVSFFILVGAISPELIQKKSHSCVGSHRRIITEHFGDASVPSHQCVTNVLGKWFGLWPSSGT